MRTIVSGFVVGLMIAACGAGVGEREETPAPDPSGSPHPTSISSPGLNPAAGTGPNTCPVTVPPQPGFVPPEPYPPEPPLEPEPFGSVWYGTPELWTMLDRNGAVWRGLPSGEGPHAIGNKTLWFSESFSTAEGEDFTGSADITVTAVALDGSAPTVVVEGGGVPSFNSDIKNFILVGLGVPEPGCWEVTAKYKDAKLTYVLLVE